MGWIYAALFVALKALTLNSLLIHTTFALVIVSYTWSTERWRLEHCYHPDETGLQHGEQDQTTGPDSTNRGRPKKLSAHSQCFQSHGLQSSKSNSFEGQLNHG